MELIFNCRKYCGKKEKMLFISFLFPFVFVVKTKDCYVKN